MPAPARARDPLLRARRCVGVLFLGLAACSPELPQQSAPATEALPSILLVTLDTTRADSLGFESDRAETPHLDALAARGVRFTQAYSTVPTTLPAHASMLTGLYPADHGLHENARVLSKEHPLLGELLRERGYRAAAIVSGLPLASQFGLARAFDHYDDDFGKDPQGGDAAERRAGATTDRALAYLSEPASRPLFLWVHYFDPHEPYDPPEPFRSRFPKDPYLGEVAFMDREVGRLLDAFKSRSSAGAYRILVVGDHGEGLGDHGEAVHGNLLYQGVLRVPLIAAGSGIDARVIDTPVSIRRVFDTALTWAGDERPHHLLAGRAETVLAEAMKPHLQYGWQPQVMAVRGQLKVIRSGEVEVYDLAADPHETTNLAGRIEIDGELRDALRAYAERALAGPEGDATELGPGTRERLASLGYVDWQGRAPARPDAPNPKDMTHLFAALDRGSGLFVHGRYDEAARVFEGVLEQDPENLMVHLRLAVAHSVSGRSARALELFERARALDPTSIDVRHYLGLHHFRAGHWDDAEVLLESVLARMPDRLPALESLAEIRERQRRPQEAAELWERVLRLRPQHAATWLRLGELRMAAGDTASAIGAFEQGRELDPDAFAHHLELGVLYLADRRLEDAADSLDQVSPGHPGHPMALFKRAQVAVLLGEPDAAERVRRASDHADETTRGLVANEALFQHFPGR